MRTRNTESRDRPDPSLLARRLSRLARTGKAERVAGSVAQLGREYPGHAGLNHALSEILAAVQEFEHAAGYARIASQLEPDNAQRAIHLAVCLIAANRHPEAREALCAIRRRVPESARSLAMLGSLMVRASGATEAEEWYRRAVELEPGNAELHFNLAAVQRFLGRLEDAEHSCDTAISLDPRQFEVHLIRSGLRTQTPDSNHVAALEELLQTPIDRYLDESMVCHALAKEYEDLGQHARSFEALTRGAALRRRHLAYNVSDDVAVIERIIRHFDRTALEAGAGRGYDNAAPIFVVGMPRTGTTLVEQVLGAHPRAIAVGELPDLPRLVSRLGRGAGIPPDMTPLELVERSLQIEMAALGRSYVQSAQALAGAAERIVDKLPFNYLNVGLIHLALPRAAIIHLTRHPIDTCYAVYKTLFRSAYPFSYDLDDLATYYIAYWRLMEHWRAVLPGRMLEVRYEALVRDPETECRRLLAHCGLEWDVRVLDFHRHGPVSMTASASQVRRPVYTSSVGKWRSYAGQLQPLIDRLRSAGIEVDANPRELSA